MTQIINFCDTFDFHEKDTFLPMLFFTWFVSIFNIYMKSTIVNTSISTKEMVPGTRK